MVELNKIFKPSLHIMDGIIGMEGEGPSAGSARDVGYILASADPAALDAAAVTMIGIDPLDVPMIRYAGEQNIGCIDIDEIEFPGEHPKTTGIKPFKLPETRVFTRIPRFLYSILYSLFRTQPVMGEKCVQCMKCAKICPVEAISKKDEKVVVNYSKCISCFCCSEICEFNAVELNASWLARKILPK
jgi:ferredoxin